MLYQAFPSAATWTSATNTGLIKLYQNHGYLQVAQHVHEVTGKAMVKLEKHFLAAAHW